jgi:hypothetical protein
MDYSDALANMDCSAALANMDYSDALGIWLVATDAPYGLSLAFLPLPILYSPIDYLAFQSLRTTMHGR